MAFICIMKTSEMKCQDLISQEKVDKKKYMFAFKSVLKANGQCELMVDVLKFCLTKRSRQNSINSDQTASSEAV